MLKATLITTAILGTGLTIMGANTLTQTNRITHSNATSVPTQHTENPTNNATLWGIYGHHDVHDCPINNKQIAEAVVAASKADLAQLFEKYGVIEFKDRYHSGLEHTFLWAVETTRPHDLQKFAIELGIAGWNDLTFVPLITFQDGVVPMVAQLHNIDR